jgi:outer membrane protein TolC
MQRVLKDRSLVCWLILGLMVSGCTARPAVETRGDRPEQLVYHAESRDGATPSSSVTRLFEKEVVKEAWSDSLVADLSDQLEQEIDQLPTLLAPLEQEAPSYASEEALLSRVMAESRVAADGDFSLGQAIEVGSRYSLEMQDTLTGYEQSLGQLQASRGQFDTTLNGQAAVIRTPSYEADTGTTLTDSSTYKVSFANLFTSGILMEIGAQRVGTGVRVSGFHSTYGEQEYSFSLNIPLLKGLGRENAAASLLSADILADAALNDVVHQASLSIGQVAANYWSYLLSCRLLEAAVAAEMDSQEMVRITEQLVARDARPRTALHSLRADWLNKVAQRKLQQQTLLEARENLALSLGLPQHLSTRIPVPTTDFPRPDLKLVEDLLARRPTVIRQSLGRRGDYLADTLRLESTIVLEKEARNALLPDLSLQGGVNQWGGGMLNQYTDLGDRDSDVETAYSAGLYLTVPLANNAAEGTLRERKGQRLSSAYTALQTARSVINQASIALSDLYLSSTALESDRAALAQHEKAYDDEQAKYLLGSSTVTDILNVADQRNAARQTFLSTQSRLANAIITFNTAAGSLVHRDRERIVVDIEALLIPKS